MAEAFEGLQAEDDHQVPGAATDSLSSNTQLGRAVQSACSELELLSLLAVQLLTKEKAISALSAGLHANCENYLSFYSSELSGIVTDPALMIVSVDDHLVHRGHAVFDTAVITEGYLYQLDAHLQRFFTSAKKAGLLLPFPAAQIRRIILETAAAGKKMHGYVRYWLGAGRGGFGLSPSECISPSFYVVAYQAAEDPMRHLSGWRIKTSRVPAKDPYFATLKSNNYLANALVAMDAEASGYDQGVFVDEAGFVAEGPTMNLGVVTHEGELVIPPFERSLAGCTIKRVLELVAQHQETDVGMWATRDFEAVKKVSQRPLHVKEAKAAKEVFMVGSATKVMPVVVWDDIDFMSKVSYDRIGVGPGTVTLAMRGLLEDDMDPRSASGQHTEVPYGILTGMYD
ncbi:hypothetical protein WJX81_005802 [Elliptochloris bilobata]|uniref:Uncharacterized protein n=1 Tax=Elliptochloris bilobata TaxID=381761 RepID=A0AAW1RY55_9CHLO